MSALTLTWGAHIVALIFAVGALTCALATANARSLFAMCMCSASCHACAAVTLMALGVGDAALALALFGAALAPVLMLAGLLLSARAAKSYKRGPVLFAGIAAAGAGAAMLWASPELGSISPSLLQMHGAVAPWIAALLFVAALGCVGALGYGERGPFEPLGRRS
jgi:hypothetical protein